MLFLQISKYSDVTSEIVVTVKVLNKDVIDHAGSKSTAGKMHMCVLLIGDTDNSVVCKTRIR